MDSLSGDGKVISGKEERDKSDAEAMTIENDNGCGGRFGDVR